MGGITVTQRFRVAKKFHHGSHLEILQTTSPPKKGKRKVQGVSQSQTAALPRPQEEEETDKFKQAQTEQTYKKH